LSCRRCSASLDGTRNLVIANTVFGLVVAATALSVYLAWPGAFATIAGHTGTLFSIAGGWLSFIVLIQVRRIESRYVFLVRIPELLARLRKIAETLAALMQDYTKSESECRVQIELCRSTVGEVRRKLNGTRKKDLNELTVALDEYITEPTRRTVDIAYGKLQAAIQVISDHYADQRWSN